MNVFKTYDVRGIYPKEINSKLFYQIGLSLKSLGYNEIVLGRDARLSSETLHLALCSGILQTGINIIDLGVITSPMLSFFCAVKKVKGAMITASHNPKEYNGIKFIDENGIQLDYDYFLYKIEKIINKDNLKKLATEKHGKIIHYDLTKEYVKYIHNKFKSSFDKKLKVVFDCSNGVAWIPLEHLLKNLNIEYISINKKPDGNFPNHQPNQTIKSNLKDLQDCVKKNNADLGVIFDGDADRVGFVDNKGNIVDISTIFIILSKNIIDKNIVKKPKVVFDLRFSRYVYEFLELYGAKPIIMRVGNPFYKKLMIKDKNIVLSGELSGHIMFSEHFGIDDSLFAAFRLIEILSHRDKTLYEISQDYKKYYGSDEISLQVKDTNLVLKKIENHYKKEKRNYLDGLSVIKKRVWFNVRKSNTESLIRIVAEGYTKEEVEGELNIIKSIIEK